MSAEKVALTEWEISIFRVIQSRHPGIVISTLEEERAIFSLMRVAAALLRADMGERDVTCWSVASSIRYSLADFVFDSSKLSSKPLAADNQPHLPVEKRIMDFVNDTNKDGAHKPGILILCDVEPLIERSYGLVRILREAITKIKATRKTIVILNKEFRLPEELRSSFMRFKLNLPDMPHLCAKVRQMAEMYKNQETPDKKPTDLAAMDITDVKVRAFATACSGLTEAETGTLVTLSFARNRIHALDAVGVAMAQQEKANIILRGSALSMREPKVNFADVGGLENAKKWVEIVTPIVAKPEESKAYGLKIPSGLLLVGIPGCGKSMLAEALAKEWRLPLMFFDVGSCFGGLVGESESNVRRMIETAAASKPCVVFVDEIEKGLGGDSLDGGTTSRVKSSLLTWLQEKPDTVFVVATANDLTRLESMPELIRAGRFDQTFFVDLPDAKARAEIFSIHLRRAGHEVAPAVLQRAARATRCYSGAEIEVVVQQALRFAFSATPRRAQPSEADILQAISEVKPLAETMAESIQRLRSWCADGRAKMAGAVLEEAEIGGGGLADTAKDVVANN